MAEIEQRRGAVPLPLIAAGAWAAVGALCGMAAGFATVRINPSLTGSGAALWFGAFLACVYGVMLSVVGAGIGCWAAFRERRHARAADPSISLATRFSAWGLVAAITVGLLLFAERSGMTGSRTRVLQVGTLLVMVVASGPVCARLAGRLSGWRSWVVPAALGLGALALGLILHAVDDRPAPPVATAIPLRTLPDSRLIVLGIDGADWRRIRPLVAQGRLPTLAKLIRDGTSAPLRSLRPTRSPILWTTLMTGRRAEDHGVFGFAETPLPGLSCGVQQIYKPADLPRYVGVRPLLGRLHKLGVLTAVPVSSCHRRAKALWNILSDRGDRVAVVNWWATWPAESLNGYVVSDLNPWRAARKAKRFHVGSDTLFGIGHPPDLLAQLADALDAPAEIPRREAERAPFFAALDEADRAVLRRRRWALPMLHIIHSTDRFSAQAGLHLADRERLALLAAFLPGVDNIGHLVGERPAVIDRYYEFVDSLLAGYVQRVDDSTTLVIASDHGWEYGPEQFGHGHAPDGILLLYGAGVRRGLTLTEAPTLFDIAPTLLALLGLPVSAEMPGRVIEEALQPETLAMVPRTPIATYGPYTPPDRLPPRSRELAGETMEKLRALGYVR
jgi:hypothetical protein